MPSLEEDDFHILDEKTKTVVTADSAAHLVHRLRENRQRAGLGTMDYQQARNMVCAKYPADCEVETVGLAESVKHLGQSLNTWKRAGFPTVSDEVFEQRKAICASCPNLAGWKSLQITYCKLCRCGNGVLGIKLKMATEACPDRPSRWGKVE